MADIPIRRLGRGHRLGRFADHQQRGQSGLQFGAGGPTTFEVDAGSTLTVATPLTDPAGGGGGALIKTGSGSLILAGNNTYGGGTTVNAGALVVTGSLNGTYGAVAVNGGTLQIGDGVNSNGSVTTNIADNATLVFANPNAQTYNGAIGGSGGLTKIGAGHGSLNPDRLYGRHDDQRRQARHQCRQCNGE